MRDEIKLKYDGDPNSHLNGDLGDLCYDYSSEAVWKKGTGRGTLTGWDKLLDSDDARAVRVINAQTAAYILALDDVGKLVEVSNGSGVALTIPPSSDVAFPIGTEIDIVQTGAGLVTITAGGGVTLTKIAATLKSLGQYSRITVYKRAMNTWNVNGDLAAS